MNRAATVRERLLRMKPDRFLTGAARFGLFARALRKLPFSVVRSRKESTCVSGGGAQKDLARAVAYVLLSRTFGAVNLSSILGVQTLRRQDNALVSKQPLTGRSTVNERIPEQEGQEDARLGEPTFERPENALSCRLPRAGGSSGANRERCHSAGGAQRRVVGGLTAIVFGDGTA